MPCESCGTLHLANVPLVVPEDGGAFEWLCLCTACAAAERHLQEEARDSEFKTFECKESLRGHMGRAGGRWMTLDQWKVSPCL